MVARKPEKDPKRNFQRKKKKKNLPTSEFLCMRHKIIKEKKKKRETNDQDMKQRTRKLKRGLETGTTRPGPGTRTKSGGREREMGIQNDSETLGEMGTGAKTTVQQHPCQQSRKRQRNHDCTKQGGPINI